MWLSDFLSDESRNKLVKKPKSTLFVHFFSEKLFNRELSNFPIAIRASVHIALPKLAADKKRFEEVGGRFGVFYLF